MVQPRFSSRPPFLFTSLALVFVSLTLASCSGIGDPLCSDGSDPPCPVPATELQVTTVTSGEDLDLSAYVLTIDQQESRMGVPPDIH